MVDLSAKLPNPDMSDEEWQEYFSQMKQQIVPSKRKQLSSKQTPVYIYSYDNKSDERVYIGETAYSRYSSFINGVLRTIRSPKDNEDYCFYIYQIAELLRFEPDRLRTEYIPECRCFRLWLSPN